MIICFYYRFTICSESIICADDQAQICRLKFQDKGVVLIKLFNLRYTMDLSELMH